jgi:hypothetical protein
MLHCVALLRTDASEELSASITRDIMVNFDIVLLFTRVPIKEIMDLLGHHFEDFLGLFRHVLTHSYFTFNGQFYGQTDGVVMGSFSG